MQGLAFGARASVAWIFGRGLMVLVRRQENDNGD